MDSAKVMKIALAFSDELNTLLEAGQVPTSAQYMKAAELFTRAAEAANKETSKAAARRYSWASNSARNMGILAAYTK